MRAILLKGYGSIDNFTLDEVEMPIPDENSVLVKIQASAFNPIDYQMRQGLSESKLLKSAILGREMAGTVVQLGRNVQSFTLGDEVVAYVGSLASNGTYAQYVSVPAALLARKPAGLSFEAAAAIPMAGLTALQCVERLRLLPTQSVLVCGGAGGVGTMVIKLLLADGFTQLVTTAGSAESKAHLIALGVHEENIVDYHQPDLLTRLLARNDHQSYDCCIDTVGGTMSEICSSLLRVNGSYADITNLVTAAAHEQLFDKGATVYHVSNYAYGLSNLPSSSASNLKHYGEKLTQLFNRIEQGEFTGLPYQVVGEMNVDTVQKAHIMLEKNQTKGKKLVMRVAG